MKKTSSVLSAFLILLTAVFCFPAGQAYAAVYEPDVELYSDAYMLINLDDDSCPVVAQKNQDEKMFPASLTKIVTAMVTLNNVSDLSQKTTVSQTAYNSILGTGAQVAGLSVGEELTIEQLLYLTMVHSACDATAVLAEYVGGSIDSFVDMMNEWVASLGCRSTHFVNPDGLHDDDHYTTASDMAAVTLEAMRNETFMKIAATVEYEYNGTNYYHTNLMLRSGYVSYYYEYASGIKTGSTDEAGHCVITKASKDGYNYLAIVMGGPLLDYNNDGYVEKCSFIDAATLFEWAFDNLKYTTLIRQNEIVSELPVNNGKNADTMQLVAEENVMAIVPSGLDISTLIIEPVDEPQGLDAPVEKGQEVCKANIIYGEQVVATATLVTADSVKLSTFLKVINGIKAFFNLTVVKIVLILVVLFILIYIFLIINNYQKKKKRRLNKQKLFLEEQQRKNGGDDLPPPVGRRK